MYGITAAKLLEDDHGLYQSVEQALQGGMRILQYRDKSNDAARRLEQASSLAGLCRQHDALFIINDDVELAQKVSADGVHLGKDDDAIASARNMLGANALIGCSCYNRLDLAIKSQQLGADYVAFGRFFASRTKPQAVEAGIDILQRARESLDIPICAIGGITLPNAGSLVEAGADMVAVIEDLFSAEDIGQRAAGYHALFD